MGESHRLSVGTHVGRNFGELLGWYLCLLAWPPLGSRPLREDSLAASDAEAVRVARAIFQTSRCQDCFSCTLHPRASVRSSQPFGRHNENAVGGLSMVQSRGVGGLYYRLHPARVFFWQEVETSSSMVRADGALRDPGRDHSHHSRFRFPTHAIPTCCTLFAKGRKQKA